MPETITWVAHGEPPIIALHPRDKLDIAVCDDGTVIICLGPDDMPNQTLEIPAHLVTCLAATLARV